MRSLLLFLILFPTLCFSQGWNHSSMEFTRFFPVDSLILGKWFLDEIRVTELHNNDTISLSTKVNEIKFIEFDKEEFIISPDTIRRFYYPNIPWNYKIYYDSIYQDYMIDHWQRKKKRKSRIYSTRIIKLTPDEFIYEERDYSGDLNFKSQTTLYKYKRAGSDKTKLLGKWYYDGQDFPICSFKDFDPTRETRLYPTKELASENIDNIRPESYSQSCDLNFIENALEDQIECYCAVENTIGGLMIVRYTIDPEKHLLYIINSRMYVFNYRFDDEGNLLLKRNQEQMDLLNK